MACEKCFKDRKLKRCFGPGIHVKGIEMCRKCWQIAKMVIRAHVAAQKVKDAA